MINLINVTPLNTTSSYYYECEKCGDKNTVTFNNRLIHTDESSDIDALANELCPKCGNNLA